MDQICSMSINLSSIVITKYNSQKTL